MAGDAQTVQSPAVLLVPQRSYSSAADIYGPSEALIGRYLASHPDTKPNVQVGWGAQRCMYSCTPWAVLWDAWQLQPALRSAPYTVSLGASPHGLHFFLVNVLQYVRLQVLTKFCCFGDSMNGAKELRFVEQARRWWWWCVYVLCGAVMVVRVCGAGKAGVVW